jgi:hypothetical protein
MKSQFHPRDAGMVQHTQIISADDMTLYLKNPKLLAIINSFTKVAGYKINKQKSIVFVDN